MRKDVKSEGKTFKVTLMGGNDAREITVRDDQYILDAADEAGIDLPATCRGGICGACVARVASGESHLPAKTGVCAWPCAELHACMHACSKAMQT